MLGRPPPARLGAVVVGPDQLVEERVAAEDLVEQQLAVVRLAVVDVEVQRAVRGQQLSRARAAAAPESQVVVELVVVAERLQQRRPVAPPAETDARPRRDLAASVATSVAVPAPGRC